MTSRQKSALDYLESRIQFCRHCTIVVFILGLLAGVSVLCGRSPLFSFGFPAPYPDLIKIILCFAISWAGIATASAYRRRIRYISEHRNRILIHSDNGPAFPAPIREQWILEVQVLFGMLSGFAVAVCCVDYPVPNLSHFLDLPLLQLALLGGFFLFCRASAKLEKKNSMVGLNPIQDLIRSQQKQAHIRNHKPALLPVDWVSGNILRESRAVTAQDRPTIRP